MKTRFEGTILKMFALAVAGLLATPGTGMTASSARAVEKTYSMSNGMIVASSQAYWTIGVQFTTFRARAGERTVTLSIKDSVASNVRGHIHTDIDGDGDIDEAGDFCSESDPIKVRPGQRVEVAVLLGECPDGEPSVVTEGTITATFTR